MFEVSGTASLRSDQAYEESRSLQDLLFTVFEEAAQAEGILQDADADLLSSPERWESNEVHGRLTEGEVIRVSCTVLVVDPEFIEARFERFLALNDSLVEMNKLQVDKLVQTLEEQLQAGIETTLEEKKAAGMGKD